MTLESTHSVLTGVSAFFGVGFGPAVFVDANYEMPTSVSLVQLSPQEEVLRYQKAVASSISDIQFLQQQLEQEQAIEGAHVLEAHLELLKDPMMTTEIEEKILSSNQNCLEILLESLKMLEFQFLSLKDPFFQERVRDVRDVVDRIVGHLGSRLKRSLHGIAPGSVIFAEDLSPTEVARLKPGSVAGLVTREGGITSHSAIIAKSKGIPYITLVPFETYPDKTLAILDGRTGEVLLDPDQVTYLRYIQIKHALVEKDKKLLHHMHHQVQTKDGTRICLYLNLNDVDEVETPPPLIEGVGLFRTEFLLASNGVIPSQDAQYEVYRKLLEKFCDQEVTIRVFDFGGDKGVVFREQMAEPNPSLGCRAIRLLLRHREMFRTQLRALLRASLYGRLRILLPMITTLEELQESKALIESVRQELLDEGVAIQAKIPLGCMIEVPSAALIADHLLKECDFLSLGTNDLVQYTLAVDRANRLVSQMYSPLHPSVLRLLHMTLYSSGHMDSIHVCGEIASDPLYIPVFIALGMRFFSVSQHAMSRVVDCIQHLSLAQCQEMLRQALACATAVEMKQILDIFQNPI